MRPFLSNLRARDLAARHRCCRGRRRPRAAAPGAGEPPAQRARAHAARDGDRGHRRHERGRRDARRARLRRRWRALRRRAVPAWRDVLTHARSHGASLPPVLRKALRRVPAVLVVLLALAGGAYVVDRLLLSEDESAAPAPAPLRVSVMAPGSYESAHQFAPYYVVPRSRFRDPSRLSRVARNKITTQPESALSKGALPGSPQIVRLALRSTAADAVTVDGVRFR